MIGKSACGVSRVSSWEEKINRACEMLDNYIRFMHQISYHPEELIKWRSFFIHSMDKLDVLRRTNWPEIFPELYESTLKWRRLDPLKYMGYVEYA